MIRYMIFQVPYFQPFFAKDKLLLEMTVKKANLEDIFIELTEKGGKDNEASDTDTDNDNERTESEEAEK